MINKINNLKFISEILSNKKQLPLSEMQSVMNSKEYNKTMQTIEVELNLLYEKIRLLEEMHSICDEFIRTQITENRGALMQRMHLIESAANQYNDPSFIAIPVPITETTDTVYDKNGMPITKLVLKEGALHFPTYNSEEATFSVAMQNASYMHASSSIDNIIKHQNTYTTYLLDEPKPEGIEETIEILIDNKNNVYNNIEVKPINCTVVSKNFVTFDNVVVSEAQAKKQPINTIGRVQIKLLCKSYTEDSIQVKEKSYKKKYFSKPKKKRKEP